MGQGRTPFARTFCNGRSNCSVHHRTRFSCYLAVYTGERRQQIKLQVALLAPVIGTKGFAAAETKAAIERAQALIEEAEALGEPLDDPLLFISVLYGVLDCELVQV